MENPLIWGWALIALAAVLMFAEFFIPTGGALALTSCATAVAGIVVLWSESRTWGLTGLLSVLVLGPAVLAYGLKVWPNTPIGRKVMGTPSEEEANAAAAREATERARTASLIGKEGLVLTDLRPVGIVEIEGVRHDAISETLFVPAGARVRVTGAEVAQLKVRQVH
jgi:membrane-bound ClpP family serine protease